MIKLNLYFYTCGCSDVEQPTMCFPIILNLLHLPSVLAGTPAGRTGPERELEARLTELQPGTGCTARATVFHLETYPFSKG